MIHLANNCPVAIVRSISFVILYTMISPEQVLQWLLDGTIDGIQVHMCQKNSHVTLFKDHKKIDKKKWCPDDLRDYSIIIQDAYKLRWSDVYVEKKINGYRCTCFTYEGGNFCQFRKGISSNLNLIELFNMKTKDWDKVSLIDKTGWFQISIPVTDEMKRKWLGDE